MNGSPHPCTSPHALTPPDSSRTPHECDCVMAPAIYNPNPTHKPSPPLTRAPSPPQQRPAHQRHRQEACDHRRHHRRCGQPARRHARPAAQVGSQHQQQRGDAHGPQRLHHLPHQDQTATRCIQRVLCGCGRAWGYACDLQASGCACILMRKGGGCMRVGVCTAGRKAGRATVIAPLLPRLHPPHPHDRHTRHQHRRQASDCGRRKHSRQHSPPQRLLLRLAAAAVFPASAATAAACTAASSVSGSGSC